MSQPDPSSSQAHAPGYPSGDATADQATADADLTAAVDEEIVAGDEAQLAADTAQLESDTAVRGAHPVETPVASDADLEQNTAQLVDNGGQPVDLPDGGNANEAEPQPINPDGTAIPTPAADSVDSGSAPAPESFGTPVDVEGGTAESTDEPTGDPSPQSDAAEGTQDGGS